jgi:Reverse transcriptase (RNA-dependent DNA polymerase)/Pol polyprotein, beta-barrel domain
MSSKETMSSGQSQIPISQIFNNLTDPSGASSAAGASPNAPTRIPSNVSLFDVQLSSLTTAPKLKQSTADAYQEWKQELKQWALSVGVWDVISTDARTMAQEAIDFLSPHGFTSAQIEQKYRALHKRVWGALAGSIHGAMGNSLPNSIEAEQKKAGTKSFLEYNANYLWTKIQGTFEKRAGSASISLLEEFVSLSFNLKQENPLQYRQRFESLIHRWNSIEGDEVKDGERISEQLKLAFLIRSLPRSLDTTIQAVFSSNSRPSIDHVFQAMTRQYEAGALGASKGSSSSSHGQNALSLTEETDDEETPEPPIAAALQGNPANRRGNRNGKGAKNNKNPGGTQPPGGPGPGVTEIFLSFLDGSVDAFPSPEDSDSDPYYVPDDDETSSPLAYALAAQTDPHLEQLITTRGGELILDSAASKHVVFNSALLEKTRQIEPFHLFAATGHHTIIREQGCLRLNHRAGIENVCYAPRATHNLVSLAVLLDGGAEVVKISRELIHIRKTVPNCDFAVNMQFKRAPGSSVWKFTLPDYLRQRIQATNAAFRRFSTAPAPSLPPAGSVSRPIPKKASAPAHAPAPTRATRAAAAAASASAADSQAGNFSCLTAEDALMPSHPLFELLETDCSKTIDTLLAFHEKETDLAKLWHTRLGHQSRTVLVDMNRLYNLGIPKQQLAALDQCVCDACILAKGRRARIGSVAAPQYVPAETMDCIYFDLIGPVSVYDGRNKNRAPSLGGSLYALPITEGASRSVRLELLKSKDEAAERIIATIKLWQNLTGKRLKRGHCDGAGEFINGELESFLASNGTALTYTTANTPAHNGVAERMGGVLMEIARAMLSACNASISLWGEALSYAAFIHNNTPQPSIQHRIPYDVLFKRHYEPSKMRVFGCDAFIYLDESERGKFQARFRPGVFVGYDVTQNGLRVLNPDTRRVTVSRNVKLLESSFQQVAKIQGPRDLQVLDRLTLSFPELTQSYPPQPQSHLEPNMAPATIPSSELDSPSVPTAAIPQPSETQHIATSSDASEEVVFDDDPEPAMPTEEPAPAPAVTALPLSKEARELQNAQRDWFKSPPLQVPSRRPAGFNTVTYSAGVAGVQVVESEPSVSSRGRVIKPVQPKRFLSFLENPEAAVLLSVLVSGAEPKNYKQASTGPDNRKWRAAMDEELASLERQGTWAVVPRPKDAKTITSKWVYKIKLDSNNQPVRYKARLVARGFEQTHGVDYDETFAPVVKLKSLKLILSLAAARDLEVKQVDFDTAFLNADLSHDVYMELPQGAKYPPGTVIKLRKSLYGLKQAGHDWHEVLRDLLLSLGYEQLECDKCVFIKRTADGRIIVLPLYVDDTLAVYDKQDEQIWLADKATIAARYAIKDIGDCEWVLNMKLTRDRGARIITLSQEAYIKRVLETFQLDQCKPLAYPCIDADLFIPPAGCDETPLDKREQTRYQSIVGSLLYAALTTRPDIAFAVNELGRFNAQANRFHMLAARHVLRYLAGSADQGLVFRLHGSPQDIKPEIYTDSSWANDLETRRSTSGMVVKFNGNVVSWSSRKQRTVAISSTEAEYMAASEATSEALWLRAWIKEVFQVDVPVLLYCDNQSALALAKNDTFHQRTKHIDIRYHFIRERVHWGHVVLRFVPTENQEADILTKRFNCGKRFAEQRARLVVPV